MGFFARRERRATRRRAEPQSSCVGTAVGGAAALVFDEEIEWTIVEVCDMVEEAEIVLVLRERWESNGTAAAEVQSPSTSRGTPSPTR